MDLESPEGDCAAEIYSVIGFDVAFCTSEAIAEKRREEKRREEKRREEKRREEKRREEKRREEKRREREEKRREEKRREEKRREGKKFFPIQHQSNYCCGVFG
ncbi:hypothetical protein GRJ2_000760300 [Grus japonensis]|uniref:Uncharacterized protein n=1 Tax=Grus japonensis TaxID=30415 RepID=A0ABC9WBR4_GRUJA